MFPVEFFHIAMHLVSFHIHILIEWELMSNNFICTVETTHIFYNKLSFLRHISKGKHIFQILTNRNCPSILELQFKNINIKGILKTISENCFKAKKLGVSLKNLCFL